jgi:hypothetical protein
VEALRKQRAQQLADRLAAGERWQETWLVLSAHRPKSGLSTSGIACASSSAMSSGASKSMKVQTFD